MKLFFALLCLLSALPAFAAPPAVVVILLPGSSLRDWQSADAPALHRLMQTGSVAVMNTRTAHQAGKTDLETPQAALLTLGAGARAAGTAAPSGFLPASSLVPGTRVSAAALFERRTGQKWIGQKPPSGRSVCLDWPAVVAANRSVGYDLQLGSLGDTLAAHGVSIASGGGPDADWIAVNSSGTVQHVTRLWARPGLCLIWDAGPSIQAADSTLADAAAQVAALGGRLVVLALPPGNSRERQLAPVLVWGPGVPAGLLRSPSTRRPGLVTNTDFAPSVAAAFGIPRSAFPVLPFGFAWTETAANQAVPQAEALNAEALRQSAGMRLLPYLALVLGACTLLVTGLASRVPAPALLVPPAALAAALFAVSALSFAVILLGLLAAIGTLSRFGGAGRILPFGSAALVLVLCADMVTGNTLMHRGLLGYSALEGARYYGLGNEAMGLLLGAALITAHDLWRPQKRARFVLAGGMLGITLLLGSAGAKAGGVLVSLAVFGSFLFTISGRRWTPKTIIVLAVLLVTGMTAAALGDIFLHRSSPSHIGEAVQRITAGGLGEAGDIVRRKLAIEGRLAYRSAWAALLWLGVTATGWLWRRPAADRRDAAFRTASAVGVASCLLFNDAGVVAAAIMVTLIWSAALQKKSLPVLDASSTGRLPN